MYPILAIRRALCWGDIFTLVRAHRAQHRLVLVTTLQLQQMAAPVSSVLHTAPVSAGPPHTPHQPPQTGNT